MKINTLQLTNFRNFEKLTLNFKSNFNLIVGINSTGKTAILEALSIATASWFLGLRDKFDNRNIKPEDVTFFWDEETESGFSRYPCEIYTEGVVNNINISWERSLESAEGRTRKLNALEIEQISKDIDTEIRENKQVALPLISYYGTERLWQNPKQTKQKKLRANNRFSGYENSVDSRIDKFSIIEWFRDNYLVSLREDRVLFSTVCNAILTNIEEAKEIKYSIDLEEILILISKKWLRLSQLSDGYRSILFLVADIAYKAIKLNPYLKENVLLETSGIVLIDELDMHLHPLWQRGIIENLRKTFPNIQFICTTHSPFLIQSLRSESELITLGGVSEEMEVANKSINDIAKDIQGVDVVEYSERYYKMKTAAKEFLEKVESDIDYMRELSKRNMSPEEKLQKFKEDLSNRDIELFAENPAYQAFLEMKLLSKLNEVSNETN